MTQKSSSYLPKNVSPDLSLFIELILKGTKSQIDTDLIKIPFSLLENSFINRPYAEKLLDNLRKDFDIFIEVINKRFDEYKQVDELRRKRNIDFNPEEKLRNSAFEYWARIFGLSSEDLSKYLILRILDNSDLERLNKINKKIGGKSKTLKSIHLITKSLEPKDVIFVVLDEHFETPTRFNIEESKAHYIKKLYDIAYDFDVPNKMVKYNRNLADYINNAFFKKDQIKNYIKTNDLKKPTIVQKSEKNCLVLKGNVPVKRLLIKEVPSQFQSLYIDKTK